MRIIQPIISKFECICSAVPTLAKLYSKPYYQVVKNEIDLAHITANDRVLCIGCGAVPFTAIHINKLTQAKVVAIDNNKQAVRHAENCVKKLNLNNITIAYGNGITYNPKNFSVIILALQAEPKKEIMENLLTNSITNCKIVARNPSAKYINHYDALPDYPNPDSFINQPMATFNKSLLYIT